MANPNVLVVNEFERDLLRVVLLESIKALVATRAKYHDAGIIKAIDSAIQVRNALLRKL